LGLDENAIYSGFYIQWSVLVLIHQASIDFRIGLCGAEWGRADDVLHSADAGVAIRTYHCDDQQVLRRKRDMHTADGDSPSSLSDFEKSPRVNTFLFTQMKLAYMIQLVYVGYLPREML
jgi:hypothetical protein